MADPQDSEHPFAHVCRWLMSHRDSCPKCDCTCALPKDHKGRHRCANQIKQEADHG